MKNQLRKEKKEKGSDPFEKYFNLVSRFWGQGVWKICPLGAMRKSRPAENKQVLWVNYLSVTVVILALYL